MFTRLEYAFCHGKGGSAVSFLDATMYGEFNRVIRSKLRDDPTFFPLAIRGLGRQLVEWKRVVRHRPSSRGQAHARLKAMARIVPVVTPGIIYAFYLPTLDFVPENIRATALKCRARYDYFTHVSDRIVRECLGQLFPELESLSPFLDAEEAVDAIRIDKETLLRRSEGWFLFQDKVSCGTCLETFSRMHSIVIREEKQKTSDDRKMLTGQTAYVGDGLVMGKAVVVRTKAELSKLDGRNGVVLVAPAITPDYVSSLRGVVAIVTDEGGITSHAAIIARERMTPCLIGTKSASRLIHEGDCVKLDMTAGTVQIVPVLDYVTSQNLNPAR